MEAGGDFPADTHHCYRQEEEVRLLPVIVRANETRRAVSLIVSDNGAFRFGIWGCVEWPDDVAD
jgi:hypothetical protein